MEWKLEINVSRWQLMYTLTIFYPQCVSKTKSYAAEHEFIFPTESRRHKEYDRKSSHCTRQRVTSLSNNLPVCLRVDSELSVFSTLDGVRPDTSEEEPSMVQPSIASDVDDVSTWKRRMGQFTLTWIMYNATASKELNVRKTTNPHLNHFWDIKL